jgi:hypothetical protein
VARRRDFDIACLDVFSGPSFLWAESVCLLLGIMGKPYILALHGGGLPSFGRKFPRRVGRLLRSAAAVTAPSHYLIVGMQEYRGDIAYLPNGIDIDRYQWRLRLRPRPDLIWLRSFHRIYNPLMAVEVTCRLAEVPGTASDNVT